MVQKPTVTITAATDRSVCNEDANSITLNFTIENEALGLFSTVTVSFSAACQFGDGSGRNPMGGQVKIIEQEPVLRGGSLLVMEAGRFAGWAHQPCWLMHQCIVVRLCHMST